MEKISGIIGSSPRLKSTDLQSAPPARPGSPTFGRPVGESTLAHRKDLTTAQKANMLREQMLEDKKAWKEQEAVQNIANKFFMNQIEQRNAVQASPAQGVQIPGESVSVSVPVEEATPEISELTQEEMKYMPKGSYLDRSA